MKMSSNVHILFLVKNIFYFKEPYVQWDVFMDVTGS